MRSCLNITVLGFFGLFAICGLAALVTPESAKVQPRVIEPEPEAVATESPAAEPTPEPVDPGPRMTRATFDRCRPGMTYEEVVAIVGWPDQTLSENEIGGFRTVMYQWSGGFVANANMTFQNGKLVSKAQFGL